MTTSAFFTRSILNIPWKWALSVVNFPNFIHFLKNLLTQLLLWYYEFKSPTFIRKVYFDVLKEWMEIR